MNMLEYTKEQSVNFKMHDVCQSCGMHSDKLGLLHIVKPSSVKIKTLMYKLDIDREQAEAVFDFYGINTLFLCPECIEENISKDLTTDMIKVFYETHLRLCLYSSRFLKQSHRISTKTIERLIVVNDKTDNILENIKQAQNNFKKLLE